MSVNEIRAELLRRDILVADIARRLDVCGQYIGQVLSGARRSPAIRQVIADAIEKPVSEIWVDEK